MLNLLRMDLYRLVRSKSFYICLGVLTFTSVLAFGMIYIFSNPDLLHWAMEQGMDVSQIFTDEEMREVFNNTSLTDIYHQTNISGNMLPVITSILAAIFICCEYSGGFIKNIMASHTSRWDYVLSKLFCLSIVNFLYIAFTYLLDMFMNVLTGNYFRYNALSDTLLYLLTLWLVSNGFSALMILICVFTRSIAAGVVAATVLSSGLIVILLDTLLRLFHANGIMNYTLYIRFTTAPQHYLTPGDYTGMAVGIIFTLIYIVISKIIVSKQDF